MANVFAITTVTDKLKAETGNATTVFTVTNTTSRPLRGIARIKPLGSTESAWIKIEGETERDFPAGGTHQFTVNFNKPESGNTVRQAETYSFRFDAVSSRNPDEEYTEGPVVTVEIPERKGEEPKPFPWWILIVVGILLVVGVVVGILVFRNGGDKPLPPTPTPTPEKVKVPAVINKTFAEAEKELREAGFKVEKAEEIAADKPLDKVLKQDPNGEAEPNSKITLTIPAATTVPDLQGMCTGRAIDELLNRQLVPGVISGNKEKIINCERQVFTTNPPANQLIAKGASVSLNVVCYPYVDSCSNFMASEILNSDKPVLRDPPNKNLFNFNNSNK